MSKVVGGLIKLTYRAAVGFFVVLTMLSFGLLGIALSFMGGLLFLLCWVPIVFPNALNSQRMVLFNVPLETTEPIIASVLMFLAGVVLLGVGFLFFVLTYIMRRGAKSVEKELTSWVDKTFADSVKNH